MLYCTTASPRVRHLLRVGETGLAHVFVTTTRILAARAQVVVTSNVNGGQSAYPQPGHSPPTRRHTSPRAQVEDRLRAASIWKARRRGDRRCSPRTCPGPAPPPTGEASCRGIHASHPGSQRPRAPLPPHQLADAHGRYSGSLQRNLPAGGAQSAAFAAAHRTHDNEDVPSGGSSRCTRVRRRRVLPRPGSVPRSGVPRSTEPVPATTAVIARAVSDAFTTK